jgi:hypothetical protein
MPRHPQPFYTGGPASTERVTAAMSAHRFAAVQAMATL